MVYCLYSVKHRVPYHSYLINGGMFRMYQIPALWIVNKIDVGIKLTLNDYLKKPNVRWTTRPTCIQQQGIYSKFDEGIYFGFFPIDKTALSGGKSHNMDHSIFSWNFDGIAAYLALCQALCQPTWRFVELVASRGLMWVAVVLQFGV